MYKRKKPEPPTCPHNPGVVCWTQISCEKCGWHPEVEKKRKEGQLTDFLEDHGLGVRICDGAITICDGDCENCESEDEYCEAD